MNKSQLIYCSSLPLIRSLPRDSVLLFDSVLLKDPKTRAWINRFPTKLALKSGESLKSLNSFSLVLKNLSELDFAQTTDLTFIALGGGSIGDFVGFLASVYLRGRRLIHIPSTWLSAIDSAHGGKNGLNLPAGKNQIGTFYLAEKIFIVAELLRTQPEARLKEAHGEFLKMAVISDLPSFNFLEKNGSDLTQIKMLSLLPKLIQRKNRIVSLDPFETKGHRRVLNLGHTLGHVIESYYGWPHGLCVMLGILFSVRWSYHLKLCNEETYIRISNLIEDIWPEQKLSADLAGIPLVVIHDKLSKDKKRTSATDLDFIFINKIGAVVRRKVKLKDILTEVKRQTKEY